MPELPDVEIFKRVMDQHGRGHVVARVVVADPGSLEGVSAATLQRRLKDKRLSRSRRHGKVLFAEFEDAATLAMHFGTNGSLVGLSPDEEEPASTRLMFEFTEVPTCLCQSTPHRPCLRDRQCCVLHRR